MRPETSQTSPDIRTGLRARTLAIASALMLSVSLAAPVTVHGEEPGLLSSTMQAVSVFWTDITEALGSSLYDFYCHSACDSASTSVAAAAYRNASDASGSAPRLAPHEAARPLAIAGEGETVPDTPPSGLEGVLTQTLGTAEAALPEAFAEQPLHIALPSDVFFAEKITRMSKLALAALTVDQDTASQHGSLDAIWAELNRLDRNILSGRDDISDRIGEVATEAAGVTAYLDLSDTPSSFTAGAIPYANGSATALSHSAGLVFDGTNLGVGTSSPYVTLSVAGDAAIAEGLSVQGGATSTFAHTVQAPCFSTDGTTCLGSSVSSLEDLSDVASMAESFGDLLYWNGGAWTDIATSSLSINTDDLVEGSNLFSQWATVSGGITYPGGNVGIGTSSPYAKLSVTNTGSGPSFVVEDSSSPDATPFIIDASGNVGIKSVPLGGAEITVGDADGKIQFGTEVGAEQTYVGRDGTTGDLLLRASFDDAVKVLYGSGGAEMTAFLIQEASGPTIFEITDRLDGSESTLNFMDSDDGSKLYIDEDGLVGIGTTSPSSKFAIAQTADDKAGGVWLAATDGDHRAIYMDTSQVLNFQGGSGNTATLDAAGVWTDASDIAYKENISELSYGLSELMELKPRTYTMKSSGAPQIGFVAQEIELTLPEVVTGEEGTKGVAYGHIVPVVVKAIQEQTDALFSKGEKGEDRTLFERFAERVKEAIGSLKELSVARLRTDELCVGETCVTEVELKELLEERRGDARAPAPDSQPEPILGPERAVIEEEPLSPAMSPPETAEPHTEDAPEPAKDAAHSAPLQPEPETEPQPEEESLKHPSAEKTNDPELSELEEALTDKPANEEPIDEPKPVE